ncbi:hypothetical protein SAMN04487897_101849 [Paenibacillus sp. yr247]|uniref:hypothetical protein n=1 Tax=Paenibacillus sp. yr247 TaxID=1761880 RepID=UPI0008828749|nr:hypothetical protein [Paenibacillus sp. yr247]SDN03170.1 hypothetical protein SAMN04487897_101849 [Paenibacillus sp. yr247]
MPIRLEKSHTIKSRDSGSKFTCDRFLYNHHAYDFDHDDAYSFHDGCDRPANVHHACHDEAFRGNTGDDMDIPDK